MSKKMMLLALVVASASMFALPAAASATEIHFDTATTFTGHGAAGELLSEKKPTVTCETTHVQNGVINAGGTTGSMELDFTGCHINVLGFTVKCRTVGSALDNTVKTKGTFHLITTTDGPAVLVTAETTELVCAGNTIIVHGDVIGTITSPKCGAVSNQMTLVFGANAAGTQDHTEWTGKKYELTATQNETSTSAALKAHVTLTANANGTLTCT